MKKAVYFVLLLGGSAYAAPPVAEAPIKDYGTPTTVSISTDTGAAAAWTKVPTTQTTGRMGVLLAVPSGNTGNILGHLGNCTSTSIATSIRPLQYARGTNSPLITLRDDVCLWLITSHTAAESIHYQEVKQ